MGIASIVAWAIVVGAVVAAAYYIFMKNPDVVSSFATPSTFQNTEAFSKIVLDPEQTIRSPEFQALKQYVPFPKIENVGRRTPLLGF